MDRLLSHTELNAIGADKDVEDVCESCSENIAAAQLAKADREWVEWIEKNVMVSKVPHCYQSKDCGKECPRCLYTDWKERKREIGL